MPSRNTSLVAYSESMAAELMLDAGDCESQASEIAVHEL